MLAWPVAGSDGPNLNDRDRMRTLDAVRGFALLGIFVVNILLHLGPPRTAVDVSVIRLIHSLAEYKFYPLFSLVFGIGLALQLYVKDPARSSTAIVVRRLCALYVIGVCFFIFVDANFILITYAITGLSSLIATRLRSKTILALALTSTLGGIAYTATNTWLRQPALIAPVESDLTIADAKQIDLHRLSRERSYSDWVVFRARLYWNQQTVTPRAIHLEVFGLCLLGLYLVRRGIVTDRWLLSNDATLKNASLCLLIGWLACVAIVPPAFIAMTPGRWQPIANRFCADLGGLFLSLAYAAVIIVCVNEFRQSKLLSAVRCGGRLSLTNFIIQSVVMDAVFYADGLGLDGKVPPLDGLLIALSVWCAQIVFSTWYLDHLRTGPFESLWRLATYGRHASRPLNPASIDVARELQQIDRTIRGNQVV